MLTNGQADAAFAVGKFSLAIMQGKSARTRAQAQIALSNAHRSAAQARGYMEAGIALASHTARRGAYITPPNPAARVVKQSAFDRAASNYDAAVLMSGAHGESAGNWGGVFNSIEKIRRAGGGTPADPQNKGGGGLNSSGFLGN